MISHLFLLHEVRCLWASTRRESLSSHLWFQYENLVACLKTLPATKPCQFADWENFSANRKYIVFQQISKAHTWYKKEFEGAFLPSYKRNSLCPGNW